MSLVPGQKQHLPTPIACRKARSSLFVDTACDLSSRVFRDSIAALVQRVEELAVGELQSEHRFFEEPKDVGEQGIVANERDDGGGATGVAQSDRLDRDVGVDRGLEEAGVEAANRDSARCGPLGEDEDGAFLAQAICDRLDRFQRAVTAFDEEGAPASGEKPDQGPTADLGLGYEGDRLEAADRRDIEPGDMVRDQEAWTLTPHTVNGKSQSEDLEDLSPPPACEALGRQDPPTIYEKQYGDHEPDAEMQGEPEGPTPVAQPRHFFAVVARGSDERSVRRARRP